MEKPLYPDVHVRLGGENGNAYFIMARVGKAMRRAGINQDAIDAYHDRATSGDYDNLLSETMPTVCSDCGDEEDD